MLFVLSAEHCWSSFSWSMIVYGSMIVVSSDREAVRHRRGGIGSPRWWTTSPRWWTSPRLVAHGFCHEQGELVKEGPAVVVKESREGIAHHREFLHQHYLTTSTATVLFSYDPKSAQSMRGLSPKDGSCGSCC